MEEDFETLLKLIFGEECRLITDSIAITDIDEQKHRYHVIANNSSLSVDEWVYCIGILIESTGELGYAFRLQEFNVRDCVDEFFGIELEHKAVILYINGKIYANCEELSDKYELDKTISWENKFKWRDKEFTIYIANNKYRIHKMISIEREERARNGR